MQPLASYFFRFTCRPKLVVHKKLVAVCIGVQNAVGGYGGHVCNLCCFKGVVGVNITVM